MNTPTHKLAEIPSGFFILVTRDGLVQAHIALFTNTMDPCQLDLSAEFPEARQDSPDDLSLTIRKEDAFNALISTIKNGGKTRFKGKTDGTHIYMVC